MGERGVVGECLRRRACIMISDPAAWPVPDREWCGDIAFLRVGRDWSYPAAAHPQVPWLPARAGYAPRAPSVLLPESDSGEVAGQRGATPGDRTGRAVTDEMGAFRVAVVQVHVGPEIADRSSGAERQGKGRVP